MEKKYYLEVLNRICVILDEKGITQKELCEFLGLKNKSFTEWKAGRSTSYMKKLPQIAEFLGVSVEYLLGKEKSSGSAELGEKDRKLIEAYHRSEPVIQSTVDKLLGIEEKTITVKIAARDGTYEEKTITEDEWNKIKDLPDADL